MDQYHANNIERVGWELSEDACELCQENHDASPIDIDSDWPNGDPPVHPWCACALVPVVNTEAGDTSETEQ